MKAEINTLDTEISSTKKKLDDVSKEITSLESDYEIRNTDQFKEKIAQERLGMIKGNTDKKEDEPVKIDEDEANKEDSNPLENQVEEPLEPETSNDDN